MKMQRVAATLLAMAMLGVLPPVAKAQSSSGVGSSGTGSQSATHTQPGQTYVKPTGSQLFRKYLFDAFGPYALIGAAAAAGGQSRYGYWKLFSRLKRSRG